MLSAYRPAHGCIHLLDTLVSAWGSALAPWACQAKGSAVQHFAVLYYLAKMTDQQHMGTKRQSK